MDTTTGNWMIWAAAGLVGILILLTWHVIRKGRPRPGEHVFRASRLTKGNRIFPAQVIITASSVTMLKPQFVGRIEESLHMAHVSSIQIDTNMVFSDVVVETSGGRNPLILHGHTKGDAIEMKKVVERFQSEYYKKA